MTPLNVCYAFYPTIARLTSGSEPVVWDLRSFRKPLATRSELVTLYPHTNAVFSPDDKYIITGSGATSKAGKGNVMFLEKKTLEVVKSLEVDSTPVRVFWHSKINQVRAVLLVLRMMMHQ